MPMGTYGNLWAPMGLYGSLWCPLGVYGDLWGICVLKSPTLVRLWGSGAERVRAHLCTVV